MGLLAQKNNLSITDDLVPGQPIESVAVIDKDISFNVEEFEFPIILKSLESISISAKPHSFLYIGNEKFELDHTVLEKIDIYLSTSAGIIKCKNQCHLT